MKKRILNERLSIDPYAASIGGVKMQFEIIRLGLQYIPKRVMAEFLKAHADAEVKEWENDLTVNKAVLPPDVFEKVKAVYDDILKGVKRRVKREYSVRNGWSRIQLSEDRLNQSELLLLVAHFESFMKVIHAAYLQAAPSVVFSDGFRGKSDAEIPVREVFNSKSLNLNSRAFLAPLIAKEVKWLDALNIELRAKYFQKYFGISFGTQTQMDKLKEIMRRRNQISHEIYSREPKSIEEIEELPLVSDEMLKEARHMFLEIPSNCIKVGASKYQSYFV